MDDVMVLLISFTVKAIKAIVIALLSSNFIDLRGDAEMLLSLDNMDWLLHRFASKSINHIVSSNAHQYCFFANWSVYNL